MKIKIEVTAEDIAKGKRRKRQACPMALALARTTGGLAWVNEEDWAAVNTCGPLPEEVRRFIGRFDDGMSVEPATFVLEANP